MKLRNKIAFLNTSITLLVLLISSIIIFRAVDNFNLYTVYESLVSQSNFSRQYLEEYFKLREDPEKALQSDLEIIRNHLEQQAGCKVEVTGLQIANPTSLQQKALDGRRAYLISRTGSGRQFYLASPILSNNKIIGTVVYQYSLYRVDSMRRSMLVMLLILFSAALAVSLFLNYFFSYRVIKPLEKLTGATKEFSKGNFREIDGIRTGDEIEKLTDSFNEMGRSIMDMIGELKNEHEKQKKFIDNVTHEIRTPLTNILGYADLSNRVAEEDQRKKYNAYITGEGNRLLGMVNDLLELSQLNRYELSIEKKETDLYGLIEQVAELMADRAKKFGFTLVSKPDHIRIHIDQEKIKQVLINLIDNAIKYSEGNTIEITLRKDDTVNIMVSDNGRGIPEEDLKNVTEPFYRVDKSRSRKLGGNGLGLAICSDIAKAHGGSMTIESKENAGTTVTISLQP